MTYSQQQEIGMREREMMNTAIVVSFGESSRCGYKIVKRHTCGSTVELMELVSVSKDGMNYIPDQFWKEIFGINGLKATVERMVIGND